MTLALLIDPAGFYRRRIPSRRLDPALKLRVHVNKVLPMVAGSFLLAALLHADMNSYLALRAGLKLLKIPRSTPLCCLAKGGLSP